MHMVCSTGASTNPGSSQPEPPRSDNSAQLGGSSRVKRLRPPHNGTSQTVSVIVFTLSVLFCAALVAAVWSVPTLTLANLTPDDAYYYLKIARNFVKGYGFSFDAINPTNGFQPLWMYLLLLPAYFTRELDVEIFPRVALTYQSVLLAVSVYALHRALQRQCPAAIVILGDAIALVLGLRAFMNGMETIVLFLAFTTTIWYLSHHEQVSLNAAYFATVGVLSAFVFLARLDSVFTLLAWVVLHAVMYGKNRLSWRYLLLMVVVAGLLVAPYLLYNLVAFGDWMPISGRLKNSFPRIEQPDWAQVPLHHQAIIVVLLLATGWLWRNVSSHRPLLLFLLSWSIGSALHAIHTMLFMKWGVFKWHFAPYWMPVLVLLPLLLAPWRGTRWERASYALGVVVWAVAALGAVWFFRGVLAPKTPTWAQVTYEAALWVRQHTSPDAVFAMKDAGRFGYYSDRRVINLDGLVNNMQLQEQIRAGRLREYLRERGVRYLVQHSITPDSLMVDDAPAVTQGTYRRTRIFYLSRLYHVRSEGIPLYREDEQFREHYAQGAFLIWRLR